MWYRLFLKECGVKNVIVKPIIITPGCIRLKNNVSVNYHARIEGVTNHAGINFKPGIVINDNVNIEQNMHLTCANKVVIGKDTAISANVTITDIVHPFENVTEIYKNLALIVKEVVIGDNCLILNNSVILPGAIIGKGCVVGANSIIREGVYPDFCVLAGAPAKIIKRYNFELNEWVKTAPDGSFTN
ncbi:acyltransferase [Mucilaginibacter sp. BJC16-A38]|uniref:acyltransferase n=1 Tax=Mucilaginibacter phenanthrenivorans TaxID=1234842 RepID=UPI0021572EA0|nr:acyltransferase [Mucilaginibacter phenanthrenivorans]MCR8560149.1 acyltransferase [Mucilaginibacter phenanthrenivorans]